MLVEAMPRLKPRGFSQLSCRWLSDIENQWSSRASFEEYTDQRKAPALAREPEDPFKARAVEPARRTTVPGPAASPHMGRLSVYIARNNVRLYFVALDARTRRGMGDWIQHPEYSQALIAVAESSKGNDRPRSSMRVCPPFHGCQAHNL